jgi:hypothetical protein
MTSLSWICYLVFAQFLTKEHKKARFSDYILNFFTLQYYLKISMDLYIYQKKKKDKKFCMVRNAKC